MIRLQRHGPVISLQRLGKPVHIQKTIAAPVPGLGGIRLEGDCLIERGKRFVETPHPVQRKAAIGMGLRVRLLRRGFLQQADEGRFHFDKQTRPVAITLLTEQAHRRIPGTVVTIQQPAPFGDLLQQNPAAHAQRPDQMCHRGVDRDHQIHALHHRGGVGKGVGTCVEIVKPLDRHAVRQVT